MSSLSKLVRRILGSQYVILEDAGYLTSDLKLTDEGKVALNHVLLEKYEAELVEAAKDFIARREAAAKK